MRNAGDVTEVGSIVSEEQVFKHPFFSVISRTVQTPLGVTREPQLLWDRSGKGFAIAVVTDPDGRYILVEEPKYGRMQRMLSAPTGGIKKNETIADAARREFIEETGYDASDWQLVLVDPISDFADKTDGGGHWIVVAHDAQKVGEPKSPDQKVLVLTIEEIIREHMRKSHMPAMSMAALLFVSRAKQQPHHKRTWYAWALRP